jgi:hypothetical protein
MKTVLMNMLDTRVTAPHKGNMPKFYHDPKLRMFTIMTRFTGAMTANILPRLYKSYIKNGHAGMRYQAFCTVMSTVAFAYLANILKDVLAYGSDENPYLKTKFKVAQRAVYNASLLGSLQSGVELVAPQYDFKEASWKDHPFERGYKEIANRSPLVDWADKSVQAMYNLSTGNTEKGVKGALHVAPVIGSFSGVASELSKPFHKGTTQ